MAQKFSLMDSGLLEYVIKKQAKEQSIGKPDWWYKGSIWGKIISIFYYISFAVMMFINFLIISNYSRLIGESNTKERLTEKALYENTLRAFLFATVFVIIGFILHIISNKIKNLNSGFILRTVSLCAVVVGIIILIITAYNVLLVNRINDFAEAVDVADKSTLHLELLFYHIIPSAVMFITLMLDLIRNILDRKDKKRIYDNISNDIYSEFISKNDKYSQKDWENYLKNEVEERMKKL